MYIYITLQKQIYALYTFSSLYSFWVFSTPFAMIICKVLAFTNLTEFPLSLQVCVLASFLWWWQLLFRGLFQMSCLRCHSWPWPCTKVGALGCMNWHLTRSLLCSAPSVETAASPDLVAFCTWVTWIMMAQVGKERWLWPRRWVPLMGSPLF